MQYFRGCEGVSRNFQNANLHTSRSHSTNLKMKLSLSHLEQKKFVLEGKREGTLFLVKLENIANFDYQSIHAFHELESRIFISDIRNPL